MATTRETGILTLTAAESVAAHRRVALDRAGQMILAGADTPGVGTALDNAASADAAAVKTWAATGTTKMIAAAAVAALSAVYAAADGKVSATPSGRRIGLALTAASGDGSEIEVLPDVQVATGRLYAATADSANVTNTTAETDFDRTFALAAGSLQVGDVIDIEGSVLVSGVASTPTLNIRVYLGGVVLAATGAVTVAANDVGHFRVTAVVRAVGASGSVVAFGAAGLGAPGTATMKPFNTAAATLNTTLAATVKVSATWSAASASNVVALRNLVVGRR